MPDPLRNIGPPPPVQPFDRPEDLLDMKEGEVCALNVRQSLPGEAATGGVWRVIVESLERFDGRTENPLCDLDCVRLVFASVPSAQQGAGHLGGVGEGARHEVEYGPFPLGEFRRVEFDMPLLEPAIVKRKPYYTVRLVAAQPGAGGADHNLAYDVSVICDVDTPVGTTAKSTASTYVHSDSGVRMTLTHRLLSINRDLGRTVGRIHEQAYGADATETERHDRGAAVALLLTEDPRASVRMTVDAYGNGSWWAIGVENTGREAAGVPYCGAFDHGRCFGVSGGAGRQGQPLDRFLAENGITRLLPRVERWQERLPALRLTVEECVRKSRRYSHMVKMLRTKLCFDGEEVLPWYNFQTWNVAYRASNNSQLMEYGKDEDVSSMRQELEVLLNKEVGVWVDVEQALMVVYGDEVKLGGAAIRAMHVNIPLSTAHLDRLADVAPAFRLAL